MATLEKAPLIEAWVQLRWGAVELRPDKIAFNFPPEDTDYFLGQFRRAAEESGYCNVERINPEIFGVPHVITHRFRKAPATWPCYQVGLGTFLVNQINAGYSWNKFKPDVIDGLETLNRGHPLGLTGLSRFGIELLYQDGFTFAGDQSAMDFLKSNMAIEFDLPSAFMASDRLRPEFSGVRLGFNLNTSAPPGQLLIELSEGTINGQPGLVMNTVVRSVHKDCPKWEIAEIDKWLEGAHDIQKHAFNTLINPAFARTFG